MKSTVLSSDTVAPDKKPATNSYPLQRIRSEFPFLKRDFHGQTLAWLDSAASAQKPQIVIDTMADFMTNHYANIHRGLYQLAAEATAAYEGAREKTARFLGCAENEVIFTKNGTEAINLVAQSWAAHHLKAGDEIVISELEHHANIIPWQMLRDRYQIILRVAPLTDKGVIDVEALEAMLSDRTRLLAVSHLSNALGTLQPVKEICALAQSRDIVTLIDGCQAVVHAPAEVSALGCDFYVFSGHKLYGPSGIGVLYGRKSLLAAMPPWQGGGDMIRRVTFEKTEFAEPPARFEAGTPPIAEAVALSAALTYLEDIGWENIQKHEANIGRYAKKKLQDIPGVTLLGDDDNRYGLVSFTLSDCHPHDLATLLDEQAVAVRAGHHCAQPLMQKLGVRATTRASWSVFTDFSDIDRLASGLLTARRILSGV